MKLCCFMLIFCTLFRLNWAKQAEGTNNEVKGMMVNATKWVRTVNPVIRSPARYLWNTVPAYCKPDIKALKAFRFTIKMLKKIPPPPPTRSLQPTVLGALVVSPHPISERVINNGVPPRKIWANFRAIQVQKGGGGSSFH